MKKTAMQRRAARLARNEASRKAAEGRNGKAETGGMKPRVTGYAVGPKGPLPLSDV